MNFLSVIKIEIENIVKNSQKMIDKVCNNKEQKSNNSSANSKYINSSETSCQKSNLVNRIIKKDIKGCLKDIRKTAILKKY